MLDACLLSDWCLITPPPVGIVITRVHLFIFWSRATLMISQMFSDVQHLGHVSLLTFEGPRSVQGQSSKSNYRTENVQVVVARMWFKTPLPNLTI